MFKPVRVVATIILIGSIGMVLVGAFVLRIAVRISVALYISIHLRIVSNGLQILCLGELFPLSNNSNGYNCSPVLVFVEFLAYGWYTLSYIPYARDAVKKMIGF